MKNIFPEFWYESNACWGWVRCIEDLIEKCNLQTDRVFGGVNNVDEFLDRSRQCCDHMNFGTRMEHDSEKTLRMFLEDNKVDYSILYDIGKYKL